MRSSKQALVFQAIANNILNGVYRPGQSIPSTTALCQEHSCSPGALRGAKLVLRTLGAIDGRQGEGVFITQDAAEILKRTDFDKLGL